jgi:small subunit ribosomal protein S6
MSDKKSYETVLILTPVLSEDQSKEAVAYYRKSLKDNGANITNEEHWGLRKLAYPVQKKSTGFYHVFQYEAPPAIVKELDVIYHRDERVLRYLTVSLDKHALAYLVKRKARLGKKVEDKVPPVAEKVI